MSHEEKLAKLAEQLRQILRQHGLQADIDRDKLADAFDWAATLYAWETDAEPKEPPNREEIEALPDALQRLQMLLANQSNISWLAVAIAAIETEEFGAPVERFCPG